MSSKTILIRQTGQQIAAQEGQNILQAALQSGLAYPHGCRLGRCGGCKTRLVDGQIDRLEHSRFALTEEQQARGLILACRAIPLSDVTVDWIGTDDVRGLAPSRSVTGTVSELRELTHDVRLVRIRLDEPEPLMFFAGQYADIKFGQAPVRSYSMANRPGAPELEFHIRRVPRGVTSSYVHTVLQLGEKLSLDVPRGSSYLREGHGGPILCIAGGTGLAPIKSIVETALACGMNQPFMCILERANCGIYMLLMTSGRWSANTPIWLLLLSSPGYRPLTIAGGLSPISLATISLI
ncbi:oxidoreductase FAD/NAD(P)-binding subunit [Alcaligenes sp. HPC1271]|nr:2Fe-2S iron-sulfur cluster-binding protein [Alcaligenes sp. HPC1271]EKU28255.1 oxidoreductase FAD/NAD(P)-binding subunit [Alcaligenes sp. HPC1271]